MLTIVHLELFEQARFYSGIFVSIEEQREPFPCKPKMLVRQKYEFDQRIRFHLDACCFEFMLPNDTSY